MNTFPVTRDDPSVARGNNVNTCKYLELAREAHQEMTIGARSAPRNRNWRAQRAKRTKREEKMGEGSKKGAGEGVGKRG